MDCGDPSLSDYFYSTTPACVAQGTSWKRGQKGCKSQNTRGSAMSQSFLGWLHKLDRSNGNIKRMLVRRREISRAPPLHKELQAADGCWERESWPFPGMSLFVDCSIQNGHPWDHKHTNKKNRLSRLYLCVYAHTCMYATMIIK